METFRPDLYEFFAKHGKAAAIGLVGASDIKGISVRHAQKPLTDDGRASRWSHCFLFGHNRLDRRGPSKALCRSLYIFESDLRLGLKPIMRNGAQENWLGKWCGLKVEHAAVIDMPLSDSERDIILATALQLVDDQALYPIEDLLGTWWAIITHREWKPNPFNDPHAMYCSSFARYCYREAGRDVGAGDVHLSNTAPEHIARFCREHLIVWERP